MKKKLTKILTLTFVLAMVFSVTVTLTGCGEPSTLEEYINSDADAKEAIESMNSSTDEGGMTVEVKGNSIIYTYQFADTIEADLLDDVKAQFEQYMESAGSTFENIASTMEEESGIDGITVKVIYLNGDGSEIYSKEYE
ncbi:MAG: DUF4854 domain-containing protein [Emergencia sp.]